MLNQTLSKPCLVNLILKDSQQVSSIYHMTYESMGLHSMVQNRSSNHQIDRFYSHHQWGRDRDHKNKLQYFLQLCLVHWRFRHTEVLKDHNLKTTLTCYGLPLEKYLSSGFLTKSYETNQHSYRDKLDSCSMFIYGPRREKTCLRGFRQAEFQTSLLSYRD